MFVCHEREWRLLYRLILGVIRVVEMKRPRVCLICRDRGQDKRGTAAYESEAE